MTDSRLRIAQELVQKIPDLTAGQLYWLDRVVRVFDSPHKFSINRSDLFDDATLQNFGDAIRIHHSFSEEPFSKDKFEYVLMRVLALSGHEVEVSLAPKGNPGHDATVNGVRLSLKTQADRNVKPERLWISKFMELGKGRWGEEPGELKGLRRQFLKHMKSYDRILSLRALRKFPDWEYELVEIPKALLARAKDGELKMMMGSRQFPKPGYCYARDAEGRRMFELYFDGGSERKLQVKNLDKRLCVVHATWSFTIPPE